MKGLSENDVWASLRSGKKREKSGSLVHRDDIDVTVLESITEDDTADTT